MEMALGDLLLRGTEKWAYYWCFKPGVLLSVLFDPGERGVKWMREERGVGKAGHGWAMQIPLRLVEGV